MIIFKTTITVGNLTANYMIYHFNTSVKVKLSILCAVKCFIKMRRQLKNLKLLLLNSNQPTLHQLLQVSVILGAMNASPDLVQHVRVVGVRLLKSVNIVMMLNMIPSHMFLKLVLINRVKIDAKFAGQETKKLISYKFETN